MGLPLTHRPKEPHTEPLSPAALFSRLWEQVAAHHNTTPEEVYAVLGALSHRVAKRSPRRAEPPAECNPGGAFWGEGTEGALPPCMEEDSPEALVCGLLQMLSHRRSTN